MSASVHAGEEDFARGPSTRVPALLQAIADGVIVLDHSLTIVEVNPAAERILGRARRHLVGRDRRSARLRLHREDGRPWRAADGVLEAVTRGGPEVRDLCARVLRPDRSFADVIVGGRRVFWTGGTASDVLVTMTEVTARRRAEQAAREAAEAALITFESALDGMLAVDVDGIVADINPAAEALLGLEKGEAAGRPLSALLTEPGPDALVAPRGPLGSGRGGKARRRLAGRARRPDGSEFPVEVGASSFSRSGRLVALLSVRRVGDGSGPVAAPTAAASLRSITHDLRTPLNSILGFAQLLEREDAGELNPRQRRYLGHVVDSAEAMLGLIQELNPPPT